MRTGYLLAVAYPILGMLGFGPGVPGLSPALCLAMVLLTGELWLRALVREPVGGLTRLGLTTAAGLVTLPLVALLLHVLGVRIEARTLAAGVAVIVTAVGGLALLRRTPVAPGAPYSAGTLAAVALPSALVLLVGAGAVNTLQRLPHPAEPGYTSVALNGWAADIGHPVAIPARGLDVPIRVSSAGRPAGTEPLRVQFGDRLVGAGHLMAIAAGTTESVQVHVPAPPDGCLHVIKISLGAASTVFYGRGPAAC